MKRVLFVVVGVAALLGSALPTATAAVPVSVVGSGKTRYFFCDRAPTCIERQTTVRVATAGTAGVLEFQGGAQSRVDCVRSAVVSGRKGVVVGGTALYAFGHRLILFIGEGGRGVKPFALGYVFQMAQSGDCGSHLTARQVAQSDPGPSSRINVPANQYVVVGGG